MTHYEHIKNAARHLRKAHQEISEAIWRYGEQTGQDGPQSLLELELRAQLLENAVVDEMLREVLPSE